MPKKKVSNGTLQAACDMLQPINTTDEDHSADWWNEIFGRSLISSQQLYINRFKERLVLCENKEQVIQLSKTMQPINWPPPFKSHFYKSKFWKQILEDWLNMWEMCFNYLNTLI